MRQNTTKSSPAPIKGIATCAYTAEAMLHTVAAYIIQCRCMSLLVDLDAGDGAVGIFCAQLQTQRAASGTQVQYLGIAGQFHKMGQQDGVCAEGESLRGQMEGDPSG